MQKRINSKNYNKWKIVDIGALIIILIFSVLKTINSGVVSEEFSYYTGSITTGLYILVFILCMLPTLFYYLAIYFGIRYILKKVERKNLTYTATKDILYYRNILEDLTPFDVSILANLNIEERKDVVATILWYQNKKILDIKDEQIIYYENNNLTEKDICFLNYLKTKNLTYLDSYKQMSYKELEQKGYIIENKNSWTGVIKAFKHIGFIFLSVVLIIILALISIKIDYGFEKKIIIFIVFIFLMVIYCYNMIAFFLSGYTLKKSKYQRTKLGEEKTEYIHALQNFIHDFSNLQNAKKEQVVLWEDFLVYAVVLEENEKIINEIENSCFGNLFYTSISKIITKIYGAGNNNDNK